jgi:uncharacterized membrane protein
MRKVRRKREENGIIAIITWALTGEVEYEYATLGALAYIAWEAVGYYIHERIWIRIKIK